MIRRSIKGLRVRRSRFTVRGSGRFSVLARGRGGGTRFGAEGVRGGRSLWGLAADGIRLRKAYGATGFMRLMGLMGNGEPRTVNGEPLVVAGVAPKG